MKYPKTITLKGKKWNFVSAHVKRDVANRTIHDERRSGKNAQVIKIEGSKTNLVYSRSKKRKKK